MYTPPMFKPDRAASLAFAQARGFGTVCAWDGARPIASSLPFYLAMRMTARHGRHFTSRAAIRWSKLADGHTSWLLAVNGAGCLCFGRTGMPRRIRCRPGSIRPCI